MKGTRGDRPRMHHLQGIVLLLALVFGVEQLGHAMTKSLQSAHEQCLPLLPCVCTTDELLKVKRMENGL